MPSTGAANHAECELTIFRRRPVTANVRLMEVTVEQNDPPAFARGERATVCPKCGRDSEGLPSDAAPPRSRRSAGQLFLILWLIVCSLGCIYSVVLTYRLKMSEEANSQPGPEQWLTGRWEGRYGMTRTTFDFNRKTSSVTMVESTRALPPQLTARWRIVENEGNTITIELSKGTDEWFEISKRAREYSSTSFTIEFPRGIEVHAEENAFGQSLRVTFTSPDTMIVAPLDCTGEPHGDSVEFKRTKANMAD